MYVAYPEDGLQLTQVFASGSFMEFRMICSRVEPGVISADFFRWTSAVIVWAEGSFNFHVTAMSPTAIGLYWELSKLRFAYLISPDRSLAPPGLGKIVLGIATSEKHVSSYVIRSQLLSPVRHDTFSSPFEASHVMRALSFRNGAFFGYR